MFILFKIIFILFMGWIVNGLFLRWFDFMLNSFVYIYINWKFFNVNDVFDNWDGIIRGIIFYIVLGKIMLYEKIYFYV